MKILYMQKVKFILSLSLIFLMTVCAVAQSPIKVTTSRGSMSQGSHDCFKVTIPEANDKDVERLWKKELKNMKAKVGREKGDIFGDDATLGSVSANSVDIYAIVSSTSSGTVLTVWFDLGGAYVDAAYSGASSVKKLLENFAVDCAKDAVGQQVKEQERILGGLEKDQERLVKNKESLERDVQKWIKDIEQAKIDIEENISSQEGEGDKKLTKPERTELQRLNLAKTLRKMK